MVVPELKLEIWRRYCPYICRIIDTKDRLFAGTAVLVSDKGGEVGYALTCWHNFDPDGKIAELHPQVDLFWNDPLPDVFLLPHWVPVEDEAYRRKVRVERKWSNPLQDFAVLGVSRETINEFRLRPAKIRLGVVPREKVVAVGFHRPGDLATSDCVTGKVVEIDQLLEVKRYDSKINQYVFAGYQSVFEIRFEHRPWERGMSGGAIFDRQGVLTGIATSVAEDPQGAAIRGELLVGYGIPIVTIAEAWTTIRQYADVIPSNEITRQYIVELCQKMKDISDNYLRSIETALGTHRLIDFVMPPPRPNHLKQKEWWWIYLERGTGAFGDPISFLSLVDAQKLWESFIELRAIAGRPTSQWVDSLGFLAKEIHDQCNEFNITQDKKTWRKDHLQTHIKKVQCLDTELSKMLSR